MVSTRVSRSLDLKLSMRVNVSEISYLYRPAGIVPDPCILVESK